MCVCALVLIYNLLAHGQVCAYNFIFTYQRTPLLTQTQNSFSTLRRGSKMVYSTTKERHMDCSNS